MSYHHPMPGELARPSERSANVERLKDFCKEELAAAQTYEKALSLPVLARHSDVLGRCYASHHNRVAELTERIVNAGGAAPTSPGVWGSLLPTLATAAAAVSEKLAVSLLDEAEQRALRRYHEQQDELDAGDRVFLAERIVPAEESSSAAIGALKRTLEA
ncbi:MAG TPA: hypothetical protein VMI54_22825 [Polyangiaceae bacterium]|nr:hypothetical protein [Polyangiaceae bacterium]